jgi:GTP cyclohydrolase II
MELLQAKLKTAKGVFDFICFDRGEVHPNIALTIGDYRSRVPLVRIQSECLSGHVFSSLTCDCAGQRDDAMDMITGEGVGILIHLWQEGRGIGLANKVRGYAVQLNEGADTVDANVIIGRGIDERKYDDAAEILRTLEVPKVRLITNNPTKINGLAELGIEVVETVPVPPRVNDLNRRYLQTKVDRLGHLYQLEDAK